MGISNIFASKVLLLILSVINLSFFLFKFIISLFLLITSERASIKSFLKLSKLISTGSLFNFNLCFFLFKEYLYTFCISVIEFDNWLFVLNNLMEWNFGLNNFVFDFVYLFLIIGESYLLSIYYLF